ncbi:hypothetical protein GQ43DRAFT_203746 [Delitschia confertaspora ATCC 74209]|uniref:Uncharacterized protein n=1 Tax=Delitschia confertaspora ATCC 74209 TaxID=1513339 RepID=A0A9P4MUX6_9PLEO|nr:hypothetical protein GQ43DRAFT_203746 [Delitschia confertaspora ATCC 74209]
MLIVPSCPITRGLDSTFLLLIPVSRSSDFSLLEPLPLLPAKVCTYLRPSILSVIGILASLVFTWTRHGPEAPLLETFYIHFTLWRMKLRPTRYDRNDIFMVRTSCLVKIDPFGLILHIRQHEQASEPGNVQTQRLAVPSDTP